MSLISSSALCLAARQLRTKSVYTTSPRNAAAALYSTTPLLFNKPKPQKEETSYIDRKRAEKEKRRQVYQARMARKMLPQQQRRAHNPNHNVKRDLFRNWYHKTLIREQTINRKARQAGLDWQIKVAVVLERGSVVTPDLEDWEIAFAELKEHLGQFGKEYPPELFGNKAADDDYYDEEDKDNLYRKFVGFKPAPRETEADATGEVRTLDRQLKTDIFLAVLEDGDGISSHDEYKRWQFPTTLVQPDETLLEASERKIKELVGDNIEYWTGTNAPSAVKLEKFHPNEAKELGLFGTKTFFFRLDYMKGAITQDTLNEAEDFAWLNKDEVKDKFSSQVQNDIDRENYAMLLKYLL